MPRHLVELHLAVILYGFTAILGELLSISALPLVWWRTGLASIIFIIYASWNPGKKMQRSRYLKVAGIGIIVALHWITFYGSIKLSNASIAMVCFGSTAFLTSILEPIILKKKFIWSDFFLGALIIPGMFMVVKNLPSDAFIGVIVGLVSAFLASLFSVLNKGEVEDWSPKIFATTQMLGAFLFITVAFPVLRHFDMGNGDFIPKGIDWFYMSILVIFCTAIAFILTVRSLRHVSAFSSTLAISLEPVYGIFLAAILLKQYENLGTGFYIGAFLIFAAVLTKPILKFVSTKKTTHA